MFLFALYVELSSRFDDLGSDCVEFPADGHGSVVCQFFR